MSLPPTAPHFVLLRGGLVPATAGLVPRDILVGGEGRILSVAQHVEAPPDAEVRDIHGHIVVPGFIDAHVHGECAVLGVPPHDAAAHQGVTSYVIGQDGTSLAPGGSRIAELLEYFAAVNDRPAPETVPTGVNTWIAGYDHASTVNVGVLVPNGNLRASTVGWSSRRASPQELGAMGAMLESALDAGALGLSSGLDYVPSAHADVAETIALCRVVARYDRVYVTHMRGYGPNVRVGMEELTAVALATGVKVHVSHFSGAAAAVLPHVEDAIARGVDLTFDTYPYVSSSTLLAMVALPAEVFTEGPREALRRMADRATAAQLSEIAETRLAARADIAVLAHAPDDRWRAHLGQTLRDIARTRDASVGAVVVELLRDTQLTCSVVLHRTAFSIDDTREVRHHPLHMVGSDGIFVGELPHPRGWATFASTVRDQLDGVTGWTWSEFVEHTSGAAAKRFGLRDRGVVAAGAVADLAVLGDVHPRATYQRPRAVATGMHMVYVNGICVLDVGCMTGATPGVGLRWDA